MAKYMNCQNEMIIIMAIVEITEGKIDLLFDYKKTQIDLFIKYFKSFVVVGSDHLTILNIYQQLYKQSVNTYLNKKMFELVDARITELTRHANRISENTYEYLKNKYNLVLSVGTENMNFNLYVVLILSHYFNLIRHKTKTTYMTMHFLTNSEASIELSTITTSMKKPSKYAICYALGNIFGNKSFQCVTQIPNDIIEHIKKTEKLPGLNNL